MKISDKLSLIRDKLKLTQGAAASRFGIPFGTWKQYERGPSEPGAGALRGLMEGGININWLLGGDGPMLLEEIGKPAPDAAPVPNSPVDYDLLRTLIEGLEQALDQRRLTLAPTRKAAALQLMYEYCNLEEKADVPATVERFLKLVA